MIGAPWYLLAFGIVLILIGSLMSGWPRSGGGFIHANMRDEDIVKELNDAQRMPIGGFVILAGFLCVLGSVVWRLVRYFVA
ncbi:MAG TPA: hypothetical protein VM597_26045 [Gemmataceae bacterium]|nr:hypothetical protein [Gemmataceae bacterium]